MNNIENEKNNDTQEKLLELYNEARLMEKKQELITLFNAFFTGTSRDENWVRRNIDAFEINTEGSISLYDLIVAFNKLHNAFVKEFNELEELDLGIVTGTCGFRKNIDFNGNVSRDLHLYIEKRENDNLDYRRYFFTDDDEHELHIYEKPNELFAFTTEVGEAYCKGKAIELNHDLLKKYLDVFDKYQLLLELYYSIRNNTIFSDRAYTLFTEIENIDNEFTTKMDSFKVSFYNTYMNYSGGSFKIKANLGNELTIDLENSEAEIEKTKVNYTEEDYINILKSVYINGQYLEASRFMEEYKEPKIKYLRTNI